MASMVTGASTAMYIIAYTCKSSDVSVLSSVSSMFLKVFSRVSDFIKNVSDRLFCQWTLRTGFGNSRSRTFAYLNIQRKLLISSFRQAPAAKRAALVDHFSPSLAHIPFASHASSGS
jgi:hypothetical protein